MITNTNPYFRTILTSLLAALLLLLIAAQGASGEPNARTPLEPGAETGEPPDSSQLLRKAEQEGSVRVIIGLLTDFTPEGRLSRSQAVDQRRDIAATGVDLRADLGATEYRTVRRFDTIPYVALELSPEALRAAQRSPNVTMIHEDEAMAPALAESGPIVQAPEMWSAGYTGSGQTIAVLDTGVDSSHPFLSGKVVDEACYSAGSDCPNGSTSQTGTASGSPCTFDAISCYHGTHVAGIAAGEGSDYSGVASDADIVSIRVVSEFTGTVCDDAETIADPCALSYSSDLIAGLERVYELRSSHDFSSVNVSFGGGRHFINCDALYPEYKAAIDNLKSEDIATVAASGNKGYSDSIAKPACISSAVSVGATSDTDLLYGFSNSASFLDLLAPGMNIESSVPGGEFGSRDGTSMAAPHVAGAWALLRQQKPSASVDEIQSALKSTGTPVTDTRTTDGVTKPRINIAEASIALSPLANDDFANARGLLSSKTFTVEGNNVGATRQSDEPDHLLGSLFIGEHSLWYKWTAPITGRVTLNTCVSSFDTALAVYTGNSLNPPLNSVASDDNSCPSSLVFNGEGSMVTFDVTGGTSYKIAVSGRSQFQQRDFTLAAFYAPPANDAFADAQVISGSNASADGNNIGATRQLHEPDHLPGYSLSGENSVWYDWTAPGTGEVTVNTCVSDFDTILNIYTGSSLIPPLNPVASDDESCSTPNDSGSKVTFDAVEGTSYKIAVSSFYNDLEGTFTLGVDQDVTPPRVKSVKPAGGATGVGPAANVRAVFSEAMLATTINADTFTLRKKGTNKKVSATVSYDPATKKAILNPEANLERGATYIARISPQATDEAGNHLDQKPATTGNQAKIWKFKVKP